MERSWTRLNGLSRPWVASVFGAVLVGFAGCRDENAMPSLRTYPVKGKVLLADGTPLTKGWVYFHRQENPPIRVAGEIGPDGSFELTTRTPGDGAPAGRYGVQIDAAPTKQLGPARKGNKTTTRIPSRYADEDGQGLIVTVEAKPNELEPFRLK
jgi:hypothetical protein